MLTILNEKIRFGLMKNKLQNLDLNNLNYEEIQNIRKLSLTKQIMLTYISKIAAPLYKLFNTKGLWIYALARLIT